MKTTVGGAFGDSCADDATQQRIAKRRAANFSVLAVANVFLCIEKEGS